MKYMAARLGETTLQIMGGVVMNLIILIAFAVTGLVASMLLDIYHADEIAAVFYMFKMEYIYGAFGALISIAVYHVLLKLTGHSDTLMYPCSNGMVSNVASDVSKSPRHPDEGTSQQGAITKDTQLEMSQP